MQKGSENVVKLTKVKPTDRVVIIADKECLNIGKTIKAEVDKTGAFCKMFIMEDYVSRPALDFPKTLEKDIREANPNVSIYTATGKKGELPAFRRPLMILLTKALNCRHAHMINIDEEIMNAGMAADYDKVYDTTHKVYNLVSECKAIEVKSEYGTNLRVEFDSENLKWVICDGIIDTQGDFSNLPDGEVFTCPVNVNGSIFAHVLGDYLSEKYGVLESPVKIDITDGYIVNVNGKDQNVVNDFKNYVLESPDNNRVGEFAIGTNVGLESLIGNLLQDEKFPGVHMAFGHPYPDKTGAKWDAPGHIDVIALETDIWVDGNKIMEKGKFLL